MMSSLILSPQFRNPGGPHQAKSTGGGAGVIVSAWSVVLSSVVVTMIDRQRDCKRRWKSFLASLWNNSHWCSTAYFLTVAAGFAENSERWFPDLGQTAKVRSRPS